MVATAELINDVADVRRLSCRREFQVLLSRDSAFVFIARDTD